jgi:hypothetical protein
MLTEKPAEGVKGYLLKDLNGKYFFRVYTDDGFIDYTLRAQEIPIELSSNFVSLYDGDNPKLDFSSQVLGKNKSD